MTNEFEKRRTTDLKNHDLEKEKLGEHLVTSEILRGGRLRMSDGTMTLQK